jgi:hypothetical protein
LEEWTELRKAGPNGFFLVLMGLSWICDLADTPEHHVALECLSADVSFVLDLKKIATLVVSGQKVGVKANAKARGGVKRKATDSTVTGAANKKKRNKK